MFVGYRCLGIYSRHYRNFIWLMIGILRLLDCTLWGGRDHPFLIMCLITPLHNKKEYVLRQKKFCEYCATTTTTVSTLGSYETITTSTGTSTVLITTSNICIWNRVIIVNTITRLWSKVVTVSTVISEYGTPDYHERNSLWHELVQLLISKHSIMHRQSTTTTFGF